MSSRAQKEALRRRILKGEVLIPEDRFERIGHRDFIQCTLCHASGMGMVLPLTGWGLSPWQIDHVLDHPVLCLCGLSYLTHGHFAQHLKVERWPHRAAHHGLVVPNPD
ncbi:MAG TPA: hypothetical protein VIT65_10715 [Microlunatus sp.]